MSDDLKTVSTVFWIGSGGRLQEHALARTSWKLLVKPRLLGLEAAYGFHVTTEWRRH